MANYKWPNVYPSIKDLSGVVATNSVTSCAYVGEAEFGPINKPTLLSSLKDYTSIFGALNSAKYGYAGYSLAVAAESIDTHYFVRTVKAGPNADTGEHEADDAMYGSVKIPAKNSSALPSTLGWYVEEIASVEKEENGEGLFNNRNYRIKSVELVNSGTNYSVDDELSIVLDTESAKVKVTSVKDEYQIVGASVVGGGTGYTNGETLTLSLDIQDARFTAQVDPEDETGELIGVYIIENGLNSTIIEGNLPISGETGTGATVHLTMANTGKINSIELINEGKSTTNEITNPVALISDESTQGTGATANIVLTNLDLDDALIFVNENPNNLKVGVKLTDSTVNENRAFAFTDVTYVAENDPNTYLATVSGVNSEVLTDLSIGDSIVISRSNITSQNGTFEVTAFDATQCTISFKYVSTTEPVQLTQGKISKYPKANERTFQVDVYLTTGRITQNVETYQYCTLYQAKDNYGNSMFIEDVINGSSDYVKVYVNPNLLNSLEEGEVLEPKLNAADDIPLALEGGQSGGRATSTDLLNAWELFRDRTQTTVSLLLNSGYTNAGETSYQNKMLEIAEYRRDCFCLFDIPMTEVEADDAIDWRKNILGTASYRAALSSPWVRTYDTVQGRANFVMCPSAFVAKLIGAAGDPWHAPAGPNRGILSAATVSPTGLTQAYDPVVGGILYADNQINCIIRDASAGYVNWGQRTLQQKPSALDRINVARTVIYIETILRDAARWHLFENNTPYERMQITLQFSAFLDTVLSAEGIASYKVICDTSNNTPIVIQNNQLVIDIIITPVYAAESIILNTTITGADASVSITSSAN